MINATVMNLLKKDIPSSIYEFSEFGCAKEVPGHDKPPRLNSIDQITRTSGLYLRTVLESAKRLFLCYSWVDFLTRKSLMWKLKILRISGVNFRFIFSSE